VTLDPLAISDEKDERRDSQLIDKGASCSHTPVPDTSNDHKFAHVSKRTHHMSKLYSRDLHKMVCNTVRMCRRQPPLKIGQSHYDSQTKSPMAMNTLIRNTVSAFLLAFLLPTVAMAQSEMMITWTGVPGEFETTIRADTLADGSQAHDVYVLEKGKVYFMLESLDINDSVVIKGQEFGDGETPATVQALPKPDGAYGTTQWPGSFFEVYGDAATFRLENLLLNGALADESNSVFSTLTARGDDQIIETDNVVFANFDWNMQSFGNDTSFDINDTVGKDYPSYLNGIFFGGFLWGGGGWMGSFKDIEITNSSIMNCWCNAIVISTHAEQALVDHVSFVNIVAGAFFHRGTNNLTVRNSLFYNSMMWRHSKRWDAILWGDDIAQGPIGVMNLASQVPADSATIANGRGYDHLSRNITWHNNAWANDQVVRDNWDSYPETWSWEGTDADGNPVTLADTTMYTADEISVWVGALGQSLMDADPTITEYDNVETTDDLALEDAYTEQMLDRIWDFRDNENHDRYTDKWWKYEADGEKVTVEWPMAEDLSYSMSSPAATASTSGGPVGDPRWSGASGVDTEEESVLPEAVALHQNYPNPFNPTTEISFTLADRSAVRLTVYNVLGQVVRTLTNEVMLPGTHSFTWDGKNSFGSAVPSGVYMYSLSTGNQVITKKMTLIK